MNEWREERWETTANFLLLDYLRARNTPKRYSPTGHPDEATRERTLCLVRAKHRWVSVMREHEIAYGKPDGETRLAVWRDEMGQAEREIDLIIAAVPVAA